MAELVDSTEKLVPTQRQRVTSFVIVEKNFFESRSKLNLLLSASPRERKCPEVLSLHYSKVQDSLQEVLKNGSVLIDSLNRQGSSHEVREASEDYGKQMSK